MAKDKPETASGKGYRIGPYLRCKEDAELLNAALRLKGKSISEWVREESDKVIEASGLRKNKARAGRTSANG